MALPSSGPISFSDVAGEVGDSTTSNISLGKLSVYDLGEYSNNRISHRKWFSWMGR